MPLRYSVMYFCMASANVGSGALSFASAPGWASSASRLFSQSRAAGSRSKVSVSPWTTMPPSLIRMRAMCATLPSARLRFVMVPIGGLPVVHASFVARNASPGPENSAE